MYTDNYDTRFASFDIKCTRIGFENPCWMAYISKPCDVNKRSRSFAWETWYQKVPTYYTSLYVSCMAVSMVVILLFLLNNVLSWPQGYKAWVHSQTQNKAQWLADCGHVSASSQLLCSILSLRMNSSFITLRPGFVIQYLCVNYSIAVILIAEWVGCFTLHVFLFFHVC